MPAPGATTSYVTKQVFCAASRRSLAPCPPPGLGTRRARVRTRRYLWTVQAPRPAYTMGVFHHLRADASYFSPQFSYRKKLYRTSNTVWISRVTRVSVDFGDDLDCSEGHLKL